jgi:two-component system chemotaxis response regulator CheB
MLETKTIRVLIVDDSAFARKVVREVLASCPQIEIIGAARDGEEGLELAAELQPDLVLCDLKMPRLDGVGFVRRQMARRPVPILIVSAAAEDAAEVLEALEAGAIEVVRKPTALATDDLRSIRDELVENVLMAVGAPVGRIARPADVPVLVPGVALAAPRIRSGQVEVVLIGVSTGGPQALRRILPQFPADFPVPIAIVLHMPVGYTAMYAEKLDEVCAIEVKEAGEGDLLLPGRALVARAGQHLTLRRTVTGDVVAHLTVNPIDKLHRPSVDVLFKSGADTFRSHVLAVVMTGMGSDGTEGAAWIKAQGGTVLTEAEKSCVIYGMPRSVAEAGLSDLAVPLDEMVQQITSHL